MLESLFAGSQKESGWIKQTANYGSELRLAGGVILNDSLYLVGGLTGATNKTSILKFNENSQTLELMGNFGQIGTAVCAWVDRSNTINWLSAFNTGNAYTWNPNVPGTVSNGGAITNFTYYRTAVPFTNNNDGAGTNKIYFPGNDTDNKLMMFDRNNLSNNIVATNFPIHGRLSVSVLVNGETYTFGGNAFRTFSTKFNPTTKVTTILADMPQARHGAAAVVMSPDIIHIIGGSNVSDYTTATTLDSILEYKISTNSWRTLTEKFPMKVMFPSYAGNSKAAYIFGGIMSTTGEMYKLTF